MNKTGIEGKLAEIDERMQSATWCVGRCLDHHSSEAAVRDIERLLRINRIMAGALEEIVRLGSYKDGPSREAAHARKALEEAGKL